MKRISHFLGCAMLLFAAQANATVHRINNNVGSSAAFNNFNTAVASASVVAGDTLYMEASSTAYTPVQLNKRLVIIGPGYFLDPASSGTPGNPGLQVNTSSARFASALPFDSLATGSKLIGLEIGTLWLDPRADSITFERCYITSQVSWNTAAANANQRAIGLRFNKCYVTAPWAINTTFTLVDLEVTNCIWATSYAPASGLIASALVRNCIFTSGITLQNTYFANNISLNVGGGSFSSTNSIVRHNISQFSGVFPAGNGNQSAPGNSATAIILNSGTTDGRYRLSVGSVAIGAGETVNGVTPDVGPFGTADPYRLSGIPPIPTIYALTTPASVPAAATTMNITLSTRSNN